MNPQAPEDAISRHDYIADLDRRKFSGMLYKLDESVGKVVAALTEKGILQVLPGTAGTN